MSNDPIGTLTQIGFSPYEAKAYTALLRESPVTGYRLARLASIPRSMIYEVAEKLIARGAAVRLRTEDAIQFAPVPAIELLDRIESEHRTLIHSLKESLEQYTTRPDLEYVWHIQGQENVLARAREMIVRAREQIYMSLSPSTFLALHAALRDAVKREVRIVLYTTRQLNLPGGRVVVTPLPQVLDRTVRPGLILIIDRQEVLIEEQPDAGACWTRSPLLVSMAENHLLRGGRHRFLTHRSICQEA